MHKFIFCHFFSSFHKVKFFLIIKFDHLTLAEIEISLGPRFGFIQDNVCLKKLDNY